MKILKKLLLLSLILQLILFCSLSGTAETAMDSEINITLFGDIMCLAGQLSQAKTGSGWNFDYAFETIKPLIEQPDLSVGNLETPVAGKEYGVTQFNQEGTPVINAPIDFLESVKRAGFDYLVTANNHAMDKGDEGMAETIKNLDKMGFYHSGTNLSSYIQDEVTVLDIKGIRVAILSYTQFVNTGTAAYKKSNRLYRLNLIDDYDDFARIKKNIKTARERNADYIIIYTHWGTENVNTSNEYQRKTAKSLANLGVDLIIGSHSHTVQPDDYIETSDGRKVFVIYSMGNLISSMGRDINHDTLVINLNLKKTGDSLEEKLSYMCITNAPRNGKNFAAYPSRLALANGAQKSNMTNSIKRITPILDDIEEVDLFPYIDYNVKF